MKKTIFSGMIEKFSKLSKFKNLKKFNNNIEMWLADHKKHFTKAELVALKRLIRYCAKFAGVSNAKIQTIVSATHKDSIGISRATFERMLRKAKTIGMVIVHNTTKNNGKGKGHNVYVFQPYFLSTIDALKDKILTYKEKRCNDNSFKDNCNNNLYETSNYKTNNIYNNLYNNRREWIERLERKMRYEKLLERFDGKIPGYNWLES